MLTNVRNLSPEETASSPKVGFESLSEISVIEESVNAPIDSTPANETPANTAGETAGVATPNTGDEVVVEPKVDEQGNHIDEAGAIIKTKEDIDSEEVISEFKIPGTSATSEGSTETAEEASRKQALADLEKESSWTALAKVRGIEITENTFDAYDKAINEDFQKKESTLRETAKAEAKEEMLAENTVEAMVIIEGTREGFTIDELLEPRRAIQALLGLSNAELVAEDCRLKGWDQELIDKRIADLTEKDLLDVEAQPLRDMLKSNEEALATKQMAQLTALKQSKLATEAKVRQKESDEIKNTLVSMKTYMDVPISDSAVNHVMQKWNNNEYHEEFTDPKVIANFLMYREFGEQGLKALKNREYQRGRDDKAKKLHNIPPVLNAGSKTNTQGAVKAAGNFGALPE